MPLSDNRTGYVDYLWKGRIAIEMKSRGKDLNAAFEQLRNCLTHLPEDAIPDLWMVCDFAAIRLCRRSTNEVYCFKTKDLRKHIKRFADIAGYVSERVRDQVEANVKATEKMARLHDALKESGYDGRGLEVYLVRLLFCLFADLLPSAEFDAKMRQTLIDCTQFDWNTISPAIFGAMFQGVMDKGQRREFGAHYTSEENILKLINPLFMDDLWREFDRVRTDLAALDRFHEKIAHLKFLDPTCGCGSFLIITYRELRALELEVLKMKINSKQLLLDITPLLKVNVGQFYGIEREDFPCQIATVGMWLIDHQMNLRVSEQFGLYYARLPLTQSAIIVRGNALRLDWQSVVPKEELNYILGNPPFVGYSHQNDEQKADILSVYLDVNGKPFKTAGKIDYVAAWYYKAAQYMAGTHIRSAFVSTNSITQGEQVALLGNRCLRCSASTLISPIVPSNGATKPRVRQRFIA